jgi:hypothetical protein
MALIKNDLVSYGKNNRYIKTSVRSSYCYNLVEGRGGEGSMTAAAQVRGRGGKV